MRLSFSFQQETPSSLHIEVPEMFEKLHPARRRCGSESEFLRPWRQVLSSSTAKARRKKENKIEK